MHGNYDFLGIWSLILLVFGSEVLSQAEWLQVLRHI